MSGVQLFVRSWYGTFIHNFYFVVVVVVGCLRPFLSPPSRRHDDGSAGVSVCVAFSHISPASAIYCRTEYNNKYIVKWFERQSCDGTGIIFTFSHFVFLALFSVLLSRAFMYAPSRMHYTACQAPVSSTQIGEQCVCGAVSGYYLIRRIIIVN